MTKMSLKELAETIEAHISACPEDADKPVYLYDPWIDEWQAPDSGSGVMDDYFDGIRFTP